MDYGQNQPLDTSGSNTSVIGIGGSCHWCTEAIFSSLKGVTQVQQGWIETAEDPENFSEAILISFNPEIISLNKLIEIHLHTHSSTAMHSMRKKYRSAVYTFDDSQGKLARFIIKELQQDFAEPIITKVEGFGTFKLNKPEYLNYCFADPDKPFCQNIVNPKLKQLLREFSGEVDHNKLKHVLGKE